jgi:small subunit ribosomal protein S4
MQIKSKYKIARRLGPAVFEKTQTQKYAARASRKKEKRGMRQPTDFGKALLEKQKARFTYLINERQFKRYAETANGEALKKPEDSLFQAVEMRLDNTTYRMGLASTRLAARQMVNHGHIQVNGRRVSIPSAHVEVGDIVSVMPRSRGSKLFANLTEKAKEYKLPEWVTFDVSKFEGKVLAVPKLVPTELAFDIAAILDFYKR